MSGGRSYRRFEDEGWDDGVELTVPSGSKRSAGGLDGTPSGVGATFEHGGPHRKRRVTYIASALVVLVAVVLSVALYYGLNSGTGSGQASSDGAFYPGPADPLAEGGEQLIGGSGGGVAERGEQLTGGDSEHGHEHGHDHAAGECPFDQDADGGPGLMDWLAVPLMYNLTVNLTGSNFLPDDEAASHAFNASVAILLNVTQSTTCITLHAAPGLNVTVLRLRRQEDSHTHCLCGSVGCHDDDCGGLLHRVGPGKEVGGADPQLLLVGTGDHVLPGGELAWLTLEYSGRLGEGGRGMFRSPAYNYTHMGREAQTVMIATQLESTNARLVLPCYDEPRFKAVFSVQLQVPGRMEALSNGHVVDRTPVDPPPPPAVAEQQGTATTGSGNGDDITANATTTPLDGDLVLYSFSPTPPMSTYLLAMAAGPLDSRKAGDVTVWAVPGKAGRLEVALEAAVGALAFYANYTGVQQPLAHFDLVAVPGFTWAMENWGLLLFDEERFLYDKASEGAWGLWRAADVICHEVAHQWFGNLATCATWSDLVVNEGVASWAEYECLQALFPHQMNARALRRLATTPAGQPVGVHEGPIRQGLSRGSDPLRPPTVPLYPGGSDGVITYSKGAAVLSMVDEYLRGALGNGGLQSGLSTYVRQHRFRSATVRDLLAALLREAESSDDTEAPTVSDLAPWFERPGLPLVTLVPGGGAAAAGGGGKGSAATLVASQEPFFAYDPSGECSDAMAAEAGRNSSEASPSSTYPLALACDALQDGGAWWVPLRLAQVAAEPAGTNSDVSSGSEWVQLSGVQQELGANSVPDQSGWLGSTDGASTYRTDFPSGQAQAALEQLRAAAEDADKDGSCRGAGVWSGANKDSGCGGELSDGMLSALLQVSALLDDSFALARSGQSVSPTQAAMLAVQVAESPAAATGAGAYLVLLPALEGLQSLMPLAAAQGQACASDLVARAAALVAGPVAGELLQGVGGLREAVPRTQDAFLAALALPRLASAAALGNTSGEVHAQLCGIYRQGERQAGKEGEPKEEEQQEEEEVEQCIACADVRAAAYQAAVADPLGCVGGEEAPMWHRMLRCWDEEEGSERGLDMDQQCLYSLPATRDMKLLKQTVKVALNLPVNKRQQPPRPVPPKHGAALLHAVALHPSGQGGDLAVRAVRDHWGALQERYGRSVYELVEALHPAATQAAVQQAEKWYAGLKDVPPMHEARSLGTLRTLAGVAGDHAEELCQYLSGL